MRLVKLNQAVRYMPLVREFDSAGVPRAMGSFVRVGEDGGEGEMDAPWRLCSRVREEATATEHVED